MKQEKAKYVWEEWADKLRKRRIVKSFKKKEKQLIHKINACNKVRLYGIGIYTPWWISEEQG